MMTPNSFIAARNAAFVKGDIEWARKLLPAGADTEVVEAAFHKARAACSHAPRKLRRESREWLAQHGYRPLHGGVA